MESLSTPGKTLIWRSPMSQTVFGLPLKISLLVGNLSGKGNCKIRQA
jgi:hypothetical protein